MTGRLRPNEYDYKKRTKNIIVYSYYEKWKNEDDDYEKEEDEFDSEEPWDHDQPRTPKTDLNKLSLQDIVDMLPKDISPSDIKMKIDISSGDMGIYGQSVTFYYVKTFPADMEKFKKDLANYEARYTIYKAKKDIYNQWVEEEKKKKLELQFEDLKKKLGK